jgi:hypothetical protein
VYDVHVRARSINAGRYQMRIAPTALGRVSVKVRVVAWPIRWDVITTCQPGKVKGRLYKAAQTNTRPLTHTGLSVMQLLSEMAASDDLCIIY